MPTRKYLPSDDKLRVCVYERPPEVMKNTMVHPTKPFFAYAMFKGRHGDRVVDSGYGATEEEARQALAANLEALRAKQATAQPA